VTSVIMEGVIGFMPWLF